MLKRTTESYAFSPIEWLSSEDGTDSRRTVTIDLANFTQATHAPNGYLPGGLFVKWDDDTTGKVTADDNVAGDLAGCLWEEVQWPKDSAGAYATTGVIPTAILRRGMLIEPKLEIAPSAAARTDALAMGFQFDQY